MKKIEDVELIEHWKQEWSLKYEVKEVICKQLIVKILSYCFFFYLSIQISS